MKLTMSNVRKLSCPAGKKVDEHPDEEVRGLVLRVFESGKKSWCFRFRDESGNSRRHTIGDATAIDPLEARKLARKTAAGVAYGENPIEKKIAARKAMTCKTLFEEFLRHAKREYRHSSYKHTERFLMKYSEPLHRLPVEKVSRANIRELRDDLSKTTGVVSSNRTISSLATVWTWAIRNAHITTESNPAGFVDRLKEKPRDRLLSMEELRAIWEATEGDHVHDCLMRFLILTGVRRAEAGDMRWSELQGSLWTIPAERMKGGVAHEVTLSKEALAVLPPRSNQPYVFGGEAPFRNWSHRKAILDEACGVKDWGVHDFRRCISTELNSRSLAEPHVVEAVLAHIGVRAGVSGVYNLSSYRTQKAAALKEWAKLLTEEGVVYVAA
jgi:integrase